MLDVDLEVVLEVLADAGQVGDDVDAERAQRSCALPTPGELEELGRVDRAAAEDHLAGEDALAAGAGELHLDTDRRVPSNSTRVARARVRTSRFARAITGWR